MQIATKTLLELGVEDSKEINESQLVLLGVEESDKADWIALSLGKQLSDARAELFVLLRSIEDKEIQEKVIASLDRTVEEENDE